MGTLLPAAVLPYAKAWVSLIGVVASTLATVWAGVPSWVSIAGAVAAAVAVYLTPNTNPAPTTTAQPTPTEPEPATAQPATAPVDNPTLLDHLQEPEATP